MTTSSPKIMLTHLDWTIQRLDEILKRENTPYYRSAALQRFGLTYEMALKCIESFDAGHTVIAENAEWLSLVDAYKKLQQCLSDAGGGSVATDEIYKNLSRYGLIFQKLYKQLDALETGGS